MAYGILKVDNITFTNGGIDQTVTVSGIVQSISGNITATGTIQGATIIGTSTVSGATVTGNVGVFTTVTGGSAGFTTVTGTTVTGTTANFNAGTFTSQVSGATVTGNLAQFTTLTGGTAGFTTITGTTVTGTTANFVTVSGTTVTGNAGQFTTITGTSAGFTTITGATVTGTVGNFGSGSAAAPAVSVGTTDNGIYSPGTDQVALSTNGTGKLFVDSVGKVTVASNAPGANAEITITNAGDSNASTDCVLSAIQANRFGGQITFGRENSNSWTTASANADGYISLSPVINGANTERLRITSAGLVGIGNSSPGANLDIYTSASRYVRAFPSSGIADLEVLSNNNSQPVFAVKGTGSADLFRAFANTTQAVTIDSSGRLAIGTTAPSYALDVRTTGTSISSSFTSDQSEQYIALKDSGTTIGHVRLGSTSGSMLFFAGNGERGRFDSSGRLLVGTSSARTTLFNSTTYGSQFCVEQTGVAAASYAQASFVRNSNDVEPASIVLGKSRGTTTNAVTVVQSGDNLGLINFEGGDGTNLVDAASIACAVDGTPGANDMPGRLVFSTTADGSSTPTERMRIQQNGFTKVSSTGSYYSEPGTYHEIRSATNDNFALIVTHAGTSGNQYGINIITANDQNDATRTFLRCDGLGTTRFNLLSNGGLANYSANNANLSDRNAKKDISPAADTWDCIKQWEIVNYRYKDQPDDADLNLGVIAQQVAESCPEVITIFEEAKDDQPEKLGIKEQQMYWMAIKALQEAQVRIETLEARVAALESA